MSGQPATGAEVLFALGLERTGQFGVPAGALTAYNPVLPVAATAIPSESPAIEVNRSGWATAGVPGPKGGNLAWGFRLAPALLLEWFHHILGGCEKTEPETGVFQYVFEPTMRASHANTSVWGLICLEPVERRFFLGGRFGTLGMEIGDNTAIPIRLAGLVTHGTRLGQPEPQAGNVGAYALGPYVRGVLAGPDAGDVWIEITRDEAGGGVQFKVEQTTTSPTFPGAAVDLVLDADGRGTWQNLQGADGRDLGPWDDTNKDPVELIWPGTDHSGIAIGDQYRIPVAWQAPALSAITALQQLTSAHWEVGLRKVGDASYRMQRVNSGSLSLEWALEADRGNESKYAYDLLRPGQLVPKIAFVRSLVDAWILDLYERHLRLDVLSRFLGPQIGTGAYRESLECRLPSAGIAKDERPVSDAKTVKESVELSGETDAAGEDPPVTVTVTTARDWSPPA